MGPERPNLQDNESIKSDVSLGSRFAESKTKSSVPITMDGWGLKWNWDRLQRRPLKPTLEQL